MMQENQEILYQLKRIIESKTFSRTNINVTLLEILVKASLEGEVLKEATIGPQIFGKSYDPVKNDNKVRVYIHNLRKKLDQYYEEEADSKEIRFQIEKGKYLVNFISYKDLKSEKNKKIRNNSYIIIAGILIISSVTIYFWYFYKNKPVFWQDNFNSTFPTTVLVGDHFTISGPVTTGGAGITRDFNINSEREFSDFLMNHPDKASKMVPNPYPYITKMGPYCTKSLSCFFTERKIPFDLKLISEWDKSKINEENLIYCGQFKTMRFLKNVFSEYFPNCNINGNNIVWIDTNSGNSNEYKNVPTGEMVDYSIVSKITGPEGNGIKLFLSDNDIGVIHVIKYFLNPDSINAFYNRHKINNSDFVAVFKVSGWERTGYNMQLEKIDIKQTK